MRVVIPMIVLSVASVVSVVVSSLAAPPSADAAAVPSKVVSSKVVSSKVVPGRRTHIVRPGDTVASIARHYGVTADDVRAANGIIDDRLYRGARLIIDGSAAGPSNRGSTTSSASTPTGTSTTRNQSFARRGSDYTVQDGDYLEGIARKQGVRLSSLLRANGLRSDSLILPGDSLVVPSPGSSSATAASGAPGASKRTSSTATSAGAIGPDLRCPVPGASFMNDWGFPRDGGARFHEGTDMFASAGTTIVAPASGTIVYGSNNLGGSTFTITTRDGWVIYGAHLSKAIGSSRQVASGEAVARVGTTGNAAGGAPVFHIGVKRSGGDPMNPYPALRAACR